MSTEKKSLNLSIVTLFPDLYEPFIKTSLIGRACEKNLLTANTINLFSFCAPKERLDAPSYGPGAGMLLKPMVVQKAIESGEAQKQKAYKIFFSPQGTKLTQPLARNLAKKWLKHEHLMLVCARYEGMDARVEQHYADEIISIGDYVLMGGDLPAMVLLEAVLRHVPDIVGKQESVVQDSFTGPLVDYPEYTDPLVWKDLSVPDIIRSGNHQKIADYRQEQALRTTMRTHFDWFRSFDTPEKLRAQARKHIPPHYVALMHTDVKLKDGRIGTSSITSIDVHDIARAAKTFGFEKYFVVSPLEDQQNIIGTLLDFWRTKGPSYNQSRAQSINLVQQARDLNEVITLIKHETNKDPIIIGTSAHAQSENPNIPIITYFDQDQVWMNERPVLFVFGTASGLAPNIINRCHYLLYPIEGLSSFNHLSVRSAAAIIFDRWLGLNIQTHNQ